MINENKITTKKIRSKKAPNKPTIKTGGTEKAAKADKKPQPKMAQTNYRGNMFDSALMGDVKDGMQDFMNSFNTSFCGVNPKTNPKTDIAQDMINKLSHNIRHNFEQNMELGQELLKCKTAADFIEFQRQNFELNYKGAVKLYSELFHDMQSLATQNLKNVSSYMNKEV